MYVETHRGRISTFSFVTRIVMCAYHARGLGHISLPQERDRNTRVRKKIEKLLHLFTVQ